MDSVCRHSVYTLPPLRPPRRSGLGILFLADGNQRAEAAGSGYGAGARNVVAIAEHLATRDDIARMVACILSPENIEKRGQGFFAKVRAQFEQLGAAMDARGALRDAEIRLGLAGDLDPLRRRGGEAAALAAAIEAVLARTRHITRPRLDLLFGVGYTKDVAVALDLDLILRTGMEAEGVLRLSGLTSRPGILNVATTKLWPELTKEEVDAVISTTKRRAAPTLTAGHDLQVIREIIAALSELPASTPLSLFVPVLGARTSVCEAAARAGAARAGAAGDRAGVAVIVHADHGEMVRGEMARGEMVRGEMVRGEMVRGEMVRWFGDERAPHHVHLIGADADIESAAGWGSLLAPGQAATALVLPERPRIGHASVHTCGESGREIVAAALGAARFVVENPPLLGADRAPANDAPHPPEARDAAWPAEIHAWMRLIEQRPGLSVRERVERARLDRSGRPDTRAVAGLFCAKSLRWAEGAGLSLSNEGSRRALLNYVLTAFFIHYDARAAKGAIEEDWEAAADLATSCMLGVAAGDDGIFDAVFEGEDIESRARRREAAAAFLQGVVAGKVDITPPPGNGAPLLTSIAAEWRRAVAHHQGHSHPRVFADWQRSLQDLYRASVSEYAAELVDNPLVARLTAAPAARREAAQEIRERYVRSAPRAVGERIEALLRACERANKGDPAEAESAPTELRLWLYLHDMASSIGAGLLFRAAALRAPAAEVSATMAEALDAATTLLDYVFRLANDVSSFVGWAEGERDAKTGACAALVPAALSGAARAAAVERSLSICAAVSARSREMLEDALAALFAVWPALAEAIRRGAFVGRRVYEIGHYETLDFEAMLSIHAELSARELGAEPAVARAS